MIMPRELFRSMGQAQYIIYERQRPTLKWSLAVGEYEAWDI